MRFYTFKLESFQISNTRSRHDDTDTVTLGLQVGTKQFPVQSHFAGNLNNGSYQVNLEFGPVLITGPSITAVFTYEIYNGGSGSLPTSLVSLNRALLKKVVPLIEQTSGLVTPAGQPLGFPNFSSGEAGADVPMTGEGNPSGEAGADGSMKDGDNPFADTSDWSDLFLEAIAADIGGFLFPDCDGFVAADGIGMSKKRWDAAIDSAGGTTFTRTMSYPGTSSPAGCGSNSEYSVTWSVTRDSVIGSLRQFLSDHGLVPDPGLRSLA
jgi:hypothetical protein